MFPSYQQPEEESLKLLPRLGEFQEDQQDVSLASRAGADLSKAASTKSFRIVCLLFAVVSIMFSVSPSSVISGDNSSSLRSSSKISSLDSLDQKWECPTGDSWPDYSCSVCCPAGSSAPSAFPSELPTLLPTELPSVLPTFLPSENPSKTPTAVPTFVPTADPTKTPTALPSTNKPTTMVPTIIPTKSPSFLPSLMPTTSRPSLVPTRAPTIAGLLHRYSFNDGTAGDSISGLDATLMSGAYVASGSVTLAKASRSYVLMPANVLGSTTSMTIEFWIKAGTANSQYSRMFEIGPTQLNNNVGSILMFRQATDSIGLQNKFGSVLTLYSTASFSSTTDSHIAVTVSTSGTVMTTKIYVNGALSVSGTSTFASGTIIDSSQGYLGKNFWVTDPFLDASFNEFRVWSIALSADVVKQNYVSGPDGL